MVRQLIDILAACSDIQWSALINLQPCYTSLGQTSIDMQPFLQYHLLIKHHTVARYVDC